MKPNLEKKQIKVSYIPYDGRELNNLAFSSKYDARWTNILKNKLEKNSSSIDTYDIVSLKDADQILCFDNIYHQNNRHFWKLFFLRKLHKCVHIEYEPPVANCRIHDKKGLKKLSKLFKFLITYNDDVVDNKKIIKGCIGDSLQKELKFNNDFKQKKLIAVLANYRVNLMIFPQHKDELYSKRGEAVLYFQDKCPNDFDLYGNYWTDEYKKTYRGGVEREKKLETINKYKFLLSYDSIRNQRGYISEKIFDCFKAKTVPIYWGADNVTDYIPKDCFIDKRDFETYDDLYNYLKNMTEEEYNKRIHAIEKYLESEQYKSLFSSEASAEIIYKAILSENKVNYFIAFFILLGFEIKRLTNYKFNFDNYYFEEKLPKKISISSFNGTNEGVKISFHTRIKKIYDVSFCAENSGGKERKILNYKRIDTENANSYDYYFDILVNSVYDKISIYMVNNKNKKKMKIVMEELYRSQCKHYKINYKRYIKITNFDICYDNKCNNKLKKFAYLFLYDKKRFINSIKDILSSSFHKLKNRMVYCLKKIKDKFNLIEKFKEKIYKNKQKNNKKFCIYNVLLIVYKLYRKLVVYTRNIRGRNTEKSLSKKEIKKISYVPYIGTPLNNEIFSEKYKNNWTYKLRELLEKERKNICTSDLLSVDKADAIIFFDNMYYKNLNTMWDLYYNRKLHNSIYIDYEPPTGHCRNHSNRGIKRLSKIFKKVITYNDDLVDGKRIVKGCIGDFLCDKIKYEGNFKNRKFLAMITNNTKQKELIGILNYYNNTDFYNEKNIKPHKKEIYSKREEAAKYFLKKCPDDFDLYGVHWSDEYKKVTKGYIPRNEKLNTISKYKFLISYDSIRNQRGYVSEKTFDAFRAKTIPIYWGADNVTDYIPKECFIDKRDFESYNDLYKYLKNMTEEEYNYRINSIEKYLESEQYKSLFSSEASAKIIYDAVMEESVDFNYKLAKKMLDKLQNQKNKINKKEVILISASSDPRNRRNYYIQFIYHSFLKENLEFVITKNGIPAKIVDYKKTVSEYKEIYEYTFAINVLNMDFGDKINVYIRKGDYLKALRVKESIDGYHSSIGLNISNNKLSITRKE